MTEKKIRYFAVSNIGVLCGLFQSNNDKAIDFQISQLLKNPQLVVSEVDAKKYSKLQQKYSRFKSLGNG